MNLDEIHAWLWPKFIPGLFSELDPDNFLNLDAT